MKFSRAVSRVKWLNGVKINVSKTISVLVLRVLMWIRLSYLSGLFPRKDLTEFSPSPNECAVHGHSLLYRVCSW
jgi:hypothetical protein